LASYRFQTPQAYSDPQYHPIPHVASLAITA
jgi:hypothetical protein